MNKIKIKKYTLPYLSEAKSGTRLSEDKRTEIVMAIFHRLKTGCQWREIPIERYFKENYSYKSVFYHFSKWCKDGSWGTMWTELLRTYRHCLELSNIQIDGPHIRANRGRERVGFQLRKVDESTNFLYLCDNQGILLAISESIVVNIMIYLKCNSILEN
ncbi:transposase [Emticicia sp. C21]|uniref:transposase n=1 Tax=Emticicia sp. C21 TaxID=2302915 RepID=UPI00131426EA|nr:transposase [Emticicia sp. C21]